MVKWDYFNLATWLIAIVIFGFFLNSYSKIQDDADEARKYAAQVKSQADAFNFQTKEVQYSLEQAQASISSASDFCPSGQRARPVELTYVCSVLEYLSNPINAEYLRINSEASSARANSDFEASLLAAEEGIELLEANEAHFRTPGDGEFEWRKMRLLEEVAYAMFRQEKYDKALTIIEQALELEDVSSKAVSGFVLSSHLKILCERGFSGDQRSEYRDRLLAAEAKALEDLASLIVEQDLFRTNREQWVETRQLDLKYFDEDAELENICGAQGA